MGVGFADGSVSASIPVAREDGCGRTRPSFSVQQTRAWLEPEDQAQPTLQSHARGKPDSYGKHVIGSGHTWWRDAAGPNCDMTLFRTENSSASTSPGQAT